MQTNNLVTQYVVAWCDRGRNYDCPGVVVCDELIGGPISVCDALVDQADCVDSEPFEGGFVDRLAGAVA